MISDVIQEKCDKLRDTLEDSLMDAYNLSYLFEVKLEDIAICEINPDLGNRFISIAEAEGQVEIAKVKV